MTGPNRLAATISKVELSDSPSRRAALVNGPVETNALDVLAAPAWEWTPGLRQPVNPQVAVG
jgi:hypothetical protein